MISSCDYVWAFLLYLYSLITSIWDVANEKYIVKMNKIIHKKTGASFIVDYVIYVPCV